MLKFIRIFVLDYYMELLEFYNQLLKKHGKRGWWPMFDGREFAYKNKDYILPDEKQKFIICLSAILTQNTSWNNVEKAVINLHKHGLLEKNKLSKVPVEKLAALIKSSGYFNQKARKIKELIKFLDSGKEITRENLLDVWGIGKETADSMLLYAYNKPYFVVDNYTKRLL